MSSHTCLPDHKGVLADGCERCSEHAAQPMLLGLDDVKTERLWDLMVTSKYGNAGRIETDADGFATDVLYKMAVWMQRNLPLNPFVPLAQLRASLTAKP